MACSFTSRGIQRLLADACYRTERVVLNEKGKKPANWGRWLYYRLSLVASHLTGLMPGIILICQPGE